MKNIGGEFELEFEDLFSCDNESSTNTGFFASGRFAFRAIIKDLAGRSYSQLYIPDYICSSISDSLEIEGFDYQEYSIGVDFHLSETARQTFSRNPGSVVLLCDYFGLTDIEDDINFLKNCDCLIILDKVQSFFGKIPSGCDYSFNSYRKFFGLCEGAQAFCGNEVLKPDSCIEGHYQYKYLGALIKSLSIRNGGIDEKSYLEMFETGEKELDSACELLKTGFLFSRQLAKTDFEGIETKRISNYRFLHKCLEDIGISPLFPESEKDKAPLAVPIALENRNYIRKGLMDQKIYLPVHWPGIKSGGAASFLSEYGLSLVMDQRYSHDDIRRMVNALSTLNPKVIHYDS